MRVIQNFFTGLVFMGTVLMILIGIVIWIGSDSVCDPVSVAGITVECEVSDIAETNTRIWAALMVIGGTNLLFIISIFAYIRNVEALLTKQVEQTEKTNRALAAIYRGSGLV